jgi:phosphatidylinositol-bisphosphatase
MACDQLRNEQRHNRVLIGWKEQETNFLPTFKVQRQAGTEYKRQRIPSFCDRILYKSLPSRDGRLACKSFTGVPEIATSDHKPVHAEFEIQVPRCSVRLLFLL